MTRQLLPIDAVTPGRLGLNLQQKSSLLSPEWATNAKNCVVDAAQRLGVRSGYSVTTTTPTSSLDIKSMHEFLKGDGTVEMIYATDDNIYNNIITPNSIEGAIGVTDGRWYFQNFNDKCLGFQDGLKPIVYVDTAFVSVVETSGTAPLCKNGIALCAYGRVWALDSDGQTIKYSGLLDETDWGSESAGSIDMSNIWTKGMDEVKAIAAFNGSFLVFGKNHIVIWEDELGSQLGVDPTALAVVDVIEGTGCISHWTVSTIGESDIVFMSRNGLQSLGRIIQEKSNPLRTVSKYVRDQLISDSDSEDPLDLRSVYSPEQGLYLLSIPVKNVVYAFDIRNAVKDREGDIIFPCYQWYFTDSAAAAFAPQSMEVTQAGDLLLGSGTCEIYTYGADADASQTIRFEYSSPWLDLGEELGNRLKILKRIGAIIFVKNKSQVDFKWSTDFSVAEKTISKAILDPNSSEWSEAEWNLGEWSGDLYLNIIKIPARDTGQYFKVKIETDTTGQFAIQQVELFTKIGRIA